VKKIAGLYRSTWDIPTATEFWPSALEALNVNIDYHVPDLSNIPKTGPTIIMANHPFGIIDGLILCHFVAQQRSDYSILINSVLCGDPRLDPYFLPINFGTSMAARRVTATSVRSAKQSLLNGGAVMIFPAGGIATTDGIFGPAMDLPWSNLLGKLIDQTRPDIVPVHFTGQNSRLFQLASQVSITLRLSLVIRELRRMIGQSVTCRIGNRVNANQVIKNGGQSIDTITAQCRKMTESLA
jgi:putative hemolysin